MKKQVFEVDGRKFATLEELAQEFTSKLNLQINWNGNLDALNDILYGGFGTPEDGFILIWKDSALSRKKLGYEETLKQLEKRLEQCHPSNTKSINSEIELAKEHKSSTVFDWIVDIIEDKKHNDIELRLE